MRVKLGSHARHVADPFLKVDRSKLDGEIVRVTFYARYSDGDWATYDFEPFLGVEDYFQIIRGPYGQKGLLISSDSGSAEYEGAFFVETIHGTRYWANAVGQRNFVFNNETLRDSIFEGRYGRWTYLENISVTADLLPEMNPNGCR